MAALKLSSIWDRYPKNFYRPLSNFCKVNKTLFPMLSLVHTTYPTTNIQLKIVRLPQAIYIQTTWPLRWVAESHESGPIDQPTPMT